MHQIKYCVLWILISFSPVKTIAQLNITAHFSLVKGGTFVESKYNALTKTYDTLALQKIEAFYMYKFEMQAHIFEQFCKETNTEMPQQPSWSNGLMPVVNVNYDKAVAFCNWLTEKHQMCFRLPTKEEWQYAARATKNNSEDFRYNQPLPNEWVVYAKDKPKCISCMQPNETGLYAMPGNVWEWTMQDLKGFETTIVGGSYLDDEDAVKVNIRKPFLMENHRADLGFRVVVDFEDFQNYLKNNYNDTI